MKKYRLNRGVHQDKTGTYRPGDIIVTDQDLEALNRHNPFVKKFEYLGEANDGEDGTPSLGEPGNNLAADPEHRRPPRGGHFYACGGY